MDSQAERHPAMWNELARLTNSARTHLNRHAGLHVASLDITTTTRSAGRVEVYVSGRCPQACRRLLDWADTLADPSLCLQIEDNPLQPKAMLFGQFGDGVRTTVTAPLAEDDVACVPGDKVGEWVLHWLRMQTVD